MISLANVFAIGKKLHPSEFSGGQESNEFLISLEFDIEKIPSLKTSSKPASVRKASPKEKWKKHDERCPECKKVIKDLLLRAYGEVKSNYRFDAGTTADDYRTSPFFQSLRKIFSALQKHRGYKNFVRTSNLPHCDFFLPKDGFIVEFDESQHFTYPRKISLRKYPNGLELGFSRKRWIGLCEETNAKDNHPPFRDEQRAWYDTLRDFLPSYFGLKPTVRLFAKDMQWCSLDPKNWRDVMVFKNIIDMKQRKSKNWVATVLLQSRSDENYTNPDRLNELAQVVDRISEETEGDGVMLFPGGWFSAGNRKSRSIYGWVEKNVKDILKKRGRNLIACIGIDGRETDEWAKDQIVAAISRKGIVALGRKFHPAPSERGYVELAPDHLYKEEDYSRIFELNGKKYFLCACYDSFGLKHKNISNFGIDIVLDLVHGFFPKGEGGSGDVYFAKHGFAGGSKHWSCPFFGAAVFFDRKIPERWPSGVIWNKGNKSTQKWRYNDNPMKPVDVFELKIKEGTAQVRFYKP